MESPLVHGEGKSSAVGWALWEPVRKCELWGHDTLYAAAGVGAKESLMASTLSRYTFLFSRLHPNPGKG